jgi:thymidylate kinase
VTEACRAMAGVTFDGKVEITAFWRPWPRALTAGRSEMGQDNAATGRAESKAAFGRIVAIEGLDGSGKSTTVKLLAALLDAVVIRNPPASLDYERAAADALEPPARRAWYLNANRVAMQEALAVARTGRPVVLDRSIASTLCFGAAERGEIARKSDIPAEFPLPGFIVLLAVPEEERRRRHGGRGDGATTEESRLVKDDGFRERVLASYRALCTHEVDASGSPHDIAASIVCLLPAGASSPGTHR